MVSPRVTPKLWWKNHRRNLNIALENMNVKGSSKGRNRWTKKTWDITENKSSNTGYKPNDIKIILNVSE